MHFEATYHGLHKWHSHMFEHLGWMVLAKSHKHDYKVAAYKKSLDHLKKALEDKISHVREEDRRQDLKILLANVVSLIAFIDKHLKG